MDDCMSLDHATITNCSQRRGFVNDYCTPLDHATIAMFKGRKQVRGFGGKDCMPLDHVTIYSGKPQQCFKVNDCTPLDHSTISNFIQPVEMGIVHVRLCGYVVLGVFFFLFF